MIENSVFFCIYFELVSFLTVQISLQKFTTILCKDPEATGVISHPSFPTVLYIMQEHNKNIAHYKKKGFKIYKKIITTVISHRKIM